LLNRLALLWITMLIGYTTGFKCFLSQIKFQ
jgi:hypothetical protein